MNTSWPRPRPFFLSNSIWCVNDVLSHTIWSSKRQTSNRWRWSNLAGWQFRPFRARTALLPTHCRWTWWRSRSRRCWMPRGCGPPGTTTGRSVCQHTRPIQHLKAAIRVMLFNLRSTAIANNFAVRDRQTTVHIQRFIVQPFPFELQTKLFVI